MRKSLVTILFAALLCAALLGGCAVPELPSLPTPTVTPTASPPPALPAAAVPAPEAEPAPEPTPEPTDEPAPAPLEPLALNEHVIDPAFFAPANEQGELRFVDYESVFYLNGETLHKRLGVYLPYGYDGNRQYNVLLLLHTSGGTEESWLLDGHYYNFGDYTDLVSCKNMIDNLIERRLVAPLIVVTASGYPEPGPYFMQNTHYAYEQFDKEFAEDILPFIAENFATYAEGGSHEQLAAARSHFGVLGASYGSYMTYLSIFATHMDLAANYCFIGGGPIDYNYCYERWSSRGFLDYGLDCVYIVEGEYDDHAGPELAYRALLNYAPNTFSDENLHYSTIYGAAHEPREWVNGLYNTLQIFFRDEPYPIPYVVQ